MADSSRTDRRDAINEAKRSIILRAAREVFEEHGLEAANMRAIAQAAGYTPGALYGYFLSKEHIYAALLEESLDRLSAATETATASGTPADRFRAAGLAFYDFYDASPRDLDLGFYLFRGGIRPHGLSADLNRDLNARLLTCLHPITTAAVQLGLTLAEAKQATADVLAYSSGLLLLVHTKRLALFNVNARTMMDNHLCLQIRSVTKS
ncbi:TetR/AcrR family transcriptional regulator [Nocardia sp. NPDC049149]|uniref:TetR/AcrR family transcriptional regulator n=1 Tax=Nocardia sp. NPDC049149 TaxID=3364315 RepID=UPI00371F249C